MTKSLFTAVLLLLTICVSGQREDEQRFKAVAVLGANFTQIDGDFLGGYNKIGVNTGVQIHYMFEPRFSISTGILYSQKGSKSSLNLANSPTAIKIVLDYVDIPIQFNYHDKKIAVFSGGFGIGRTVRYRFFENDLPVHETEPNPYNAFNFYGTLNVTFLIKERYGVNMHFEYSVTSLGKFEDSTLKNRGQYHNVLGIRMMYLIN